MSRLWRLVPILAAVTPWAVGCDSHAVAVDECQTIEQARCKAAAGCGRGLDTGEAQAECERFSRDNCLHGLPVTDVPAASAVNACAAMIAAAGRCGDKTSANSAAACGLKVRADQTAAAACDVIANPDYSPACSFLVPGTAEVEAPVDAGHD